MRAIWSCIYSCPIEISRYKYYNFDIKGDKIIVHGDGADFDYSIDQFKDFFTLEVGTWDDVFKSDVKKDIKPKATIEESKTE